MRESRPYRFKIAIIGDNQVGKSSLMKKFTVGNFSEDYRKIAGANFSTFNKIIEGDEVKLIIWTIAADFLFFRPSLFRNSSTAIIVFSLEDNEMGRNSFNHIPKWRNEVMKYCGEIPVYLFANKADLVDEDELDELRIKKIVEENGLMGYYITSAISGDGTIEAFNDIIEELHNKYKNIKKRKRRK